MLKNYFKIAIRNLIRNKTYSIINIAGLSLGITCCSLLFLFVQDELSYDDHFKKKESIYRILEKRTADDDIRTIGMVPPPVAPSLAENYGSIDAYTRLFKFGGHINFEKDGEKFGDRAYYFVDSMFFDVFNVEWVEGSYETALKDSYSIVINEDWAKTLFGNESAIGKELNSGGEQNFVVSGVFKNLPQNSHIQFNILVALPNNSERFDQFQQDWNQYGAYTYVTLRDPAQIDKVNEQLAELVAKNYESGRNRELDLQAMKDIHFYSKDVVFGTDETKGEIAYIYIFVAIGLFMLLIACINYMNLATAKSLRRGKEIGMRKVSGAQRHQLVFQFLSESTLVALLALVISVGMIDLLLPAFNQLTDKQFLFNLDSFGNIIGLLFIITLLVGLLSGIYPALLMSRLKPANILKGQMSTGKGSVIFRKALVITQFTLSIIMIIATMVASRQMNYIQNKSLGFQKEQLLIVDINNGNVREKAETMVNEFSNSPYIKSVAVSSRVPGEWKNLREVYIQQPDFRDSLQSTFLGFDQRMIPTYKIEMMEGENFTGTKADSLHVILNETAVKQLNLKDPVGKMIDINGTSVKVIGVVRDFNFQSLYTKVGPLVVGYQYNPFQRIDYFSLKFDPEHAEEAIAHATAVHDQFDQGTPIEYHFLDAQWDAFYKEDIRAENVFKIGAGITLFIACLGLFGLASFIIKKMTKEIGVRKVLGASVMDLILLLSKTFVIQVVIAFLIAAPIGWYFMRGWLANFAFQFELGWSEFAGAGLIAILIALTTVSYRVIQATKINPAHTLKEE